jgi:hypothetical protein
MKGGTMKHLFLFRLLAFTVLSSLAHEVMPEIAIDAGSF